MANPVLSINAPLPRINQKNKLTFSPEGWAKSRDEADSSSVKKRESIRATGPDPREPTATQTPATMTTQDWIMMMTIVMTDRALWEKLRKASRIRKKTPSLKWNR